MRSMREAMMDVGLQWSEKKCAVVHEKRGCLSENSEGMKIGDSELTQSLKHGSFYKFLPVMENFKQEDQLVLKGAAKVFLQRMSVRLSGLSLCPSIMKCWHLTGSHCPSCNIWCLDSSLANIIACWPTTTRQRGKKGDHPERRKTPLWDQQNWCTSLGNSKEETL